MARNAADAQYDVAGVRDGGTLAGSGTQHGGLTGPQLPFTGFDAGLLSVAGMMLIIVGLAFTRAIKAT